MSRRAYSEINLHIVWHVKGNVPVLRDEVEAQLHRYLGRRSAEEALLLLLAVGGTDDHVHLVVTVPPTVLVSEWIGRIKGASSHYLNHVVANRKIVEWQSGYGVVSFGTRDLPWVLDYVRCQREHHAQGTVHERLERAEPQDDGKPAEAGSE